MSSASSLPSGTRNRAQPGWMAVLCFASLLLLAPPAAAQDGMIVGSVTDASTKEPVAGATVTATSPGRHGELVVRTRADGSYQLPQLQPGPYLLRFEGAGLQPYSRAGIRVSIGRTFRIDAELDPVDVIACWLPFHTVPVIDIGSNQVGLSLDQNFVRNIPLPSR